MSELRDPAGVLIVLLGYPPVREDGKQRGHRSGGPASVPFSRIQGRTGAKLTLPTGRSFPFLVTCSAPSPDDLCFSPTRVHWPMPCQALPLLGYRGCIDAGAGGRQRTAPARRAVRCLTARRSAAGERPQCRLAPVRGRELSIKRKIVMAGCGLLSVTRPRRMDRRQSDYNDERLTTDVVPSRAAAVFCGGITV
jgi:hypothetical protein